MELSAQAGDHCEVGVCSLDAAGLDAQRGRYRTLAGHAIGVERVPGSVRVTFDSSVPRELLEETIAIERGCCPFFVLRHEPGEQLLTISVESLELDSRLDPLFDALR